MNLAEIDSAKKRLEVSIRNDRSLISEYLKQKKEKSEITKIEDIIEKQSDFLIYLMIIIQENNLKKLKGEKFCNFHIIKQLSNLQQRKNSLYTADINIPSSKKKILKQEEYFNNANITEWIKAIDDESEVLRQKLSKFNKETKVKVDVPEDLITILGLEK